MYTNYTVTRPNADNHGLMQPFRLAHQCRHFLGSRTLPVCTALWRLPFLEMLVCAALVFWESRCAQRFGVRIRWMSHVLARLLFIKCWCAQHFGATAFRARTFSHFRARAPSRIETPSAHAIHPAAFRARSYRHTWVQTSPSRSETPSAHAIHHAGSYRHT